MRPDDSGGTRPTGWHVLGLAGDPTPGDGDAIRALAGHLHDFAETAENSRTSVQSLLSDEAVITWIGDSAIAFEKACDPFPGHLAVAHQSYHDAGDALDSYAPLLDAAQSTADVALSRAKEAIGTAGLTPDELQQLAQADSDTDFRTRLGRLLIAHQPAPPPPSPEAAKFPTSLPGPPPDLVVPGAGALLSGPSSELLNEVLGFRRTAQQAGEDVRSAARRYASTVRDAADKAARVQEWKYNKGGKLTSAPKDGGSFEERLSQFGGSIYALNAIAAKPLPQDDKSLAARDINELNAALDDPTAPWAMEVMQAVSSDLSNGGSSLLEAFFAAGGAVQMANVSLALAPPSDRPPYGTGPEPSAAAQAILASLGSAAAAGTKLSDGGVIKVPSNAFDPFTNPLGQMFPATALLKYGPDGSAWGPSVLGAIGEKVLLSNYGAPKADADQDAVSTILQRISQNGDASRLLVGSDGVGERNAQALLNSWWGTEDSPISRAAAQILTSAANDPTGYPALSTRAATNIFHALDGRQLPSPLAQAVANTGAVYLDSLLQDSTGQMEESGTLSSGKIPLSPEQLDTVLKSFTGDQQSVNIIDTALGFKAVHITQTGPDQDKQYISHLNQLGNLQGLVDVHQAQVGVDHAHESDHVNAVKQAWLAGALGGISASPTPHGIGEVPFQMITGSSSSAAPLFEHIWPTDSADDKIQESQFTLSSKAGSLAVPIVQGLVNAHQITPPSDAPWFNKDTGMVDISVSKLAANEFHDWLDNDPSAKAAWDANKSVNDGYVLTGKAWNVK